MSEKPKKILNIIVDQMRADCLNGALSEAIDIPNLRQLMKESVTFNRHYTVTVPCGPSRASLFTGLYAMNHRSVLNGTPLSRDHTTIATQMRKGGYDPLLFGYTDTSTDPRGLDPNDPDLKSYEGLAPGFSEIVRMRFDDNSSWRGDLLAKGYELPDYYWEMFKPITPEGQDASLSDPALYRSEDSDTAFLTDQTLKELSVRTQQNWFATVTYIRPHPPIVAPAPYNKMYQGKTSNYMPNRPNNVTQLKAAHPFNKAFLDLPSNNGLYWGFNGKVDEMSDDTIAELRAVYFGLITELDHHIGRLIQFLKDTGQYDDTLIIFTADHGEALGDHYMWGKNNPYNGSFHIPLVIRDPNNRQTAGTEVEYFTESIDLSPTLMDWIGLEPHQGFNGASLLPIVVGEKPVSWRDHIFAEMDMSNPASDSRYHNEFGTPPRECNLAIIQDEQFKLVHFNGGVQPMLFDMINDPNEANDLGTYADYQSEVLRLSQKMLNHRMTHAHHALSRMLLTDDGVVNV